MSEFLHMGGYAAYVWSSYALSFVCLGVLYVVSKTAAKKQQQKLAGKFLREQQVKQGESL